MELSVYLDHSVYIMATKNWWNYDVIDDVTTFNTAVFTSFPSLLYNIVLSINRRMKEETGSLGRQTSSTASQFFSIFCPY